MTLHNVVYGGLGGKMHGDDLHPGLQPLIQALISRGYWGPEYRTVAAVTRRLGLSKGYLNRILNGQSGLQGWTINILLPHLGFAGRALLEAAFITVARERRPQFLMRIATYDQAQPWYEGWADVALAIDSSCKRCVNVTLRALMSSKLIAALRAIEDPCSRAVFDGMLADLPPCAHRTERTLVDSERLGPGLLRPRQATLQSLLRRLRESGVFLEGSDVQDVARLLGYDAPTYSEIERAKVDFPEPLQNRLLTVLDPAYFVIFEAADEFQASQRVSPWQITTLNEAPEWYRMLTRQLDAMYELKRANTAPANSLLYATLLMTAREQLHDGIPLSPAIPSGEEASKLRTAALDARRLFRPVPTLVPGSK